MLERHIIALSTLASSALDARGVSSPSSGIAAKRRMEQLLYESSDAWKSHMRVYHTNAHDFWLDGQLLNGICSSPSDVQCNGELERWAKWASRNDPEQWQRCDHGWVRRQ